MLERHKKVFFLPKPPSQISKALFSKLWQHYVRLQVNANVKIT